jgi:hypothetical protein
MRTTLLAFLVLAAPPSAQGLERAFPSDTLVQVQFAGLQACAAASQQLGVLRLGTKVYDRLDSELKDQQVAPHLAEAVAHLHGALRRTGLDPATVRALLGGRLALGLGPRATIAGPMPMPSIALAFELGNRETEINAAIKTLEALAARGHVKLASAQQAGVLLVSNSPGYLEECQQALRGKPGFGNCRALQQGRARLGDELLSLTLNSSPLYATPSTFVPYELAELAAAVGVAAPHGVYAGWGTSGPSATQVLHIGLDTEAASALRQLGGAPVTAAAASWCPADTLAFAAVRADLPAVGQAGDRIWNMLPQQLRREMAREWEREVGRELDRELRGSGFDRRAITELVAAIGPEVAAAVSLNALHIPELTVFAQMRAPDKVRAALGQVVEQAKAEGAPIREVEYQGVAITTAVVPAGDMKLSPSIALCGDMLVFSSELRALKAALAQRDKQAGSLVADESFQQTLKQNPGSAVLVLRSDCAVDRLWALAQAGIGVLIGSGMAPGLTAEMVPTAEELKQDLDDVVVTLGFTGEGITARGQLPIGPAAALAGAGAWLDWALQQKGGAATDGRPKPKRIY